ncbi:MAG: tetratricopeptide repeat protein [Ignavibacteriaceae bacterium]|nr:tetratricopeptide repeat protein [Ignavibacteriaceae bacterium]
MKNTSKKILFLLFFVISFSTFQGCGVWNDFTTYFNLYYNTSSLFNEAESAIQKEQKDIFALTEPNVPSSASGSLNKVIEKCSKILQFNSESAFVDDALFMLGKSFYYQKNYLKALRKFQELIAKQSESEYVPETELWIAKTYFQLKNFSAADKLLLQVIEKSTADKEDELFVKATIVKIKFEIGAEKYSDAVKSLKSLVNVSSDGEINAQAKYQEGELLVRLDDKEEAAKAFAEVSNYSPTFETELNAKVNYGKIIRSLGKEDEALELFLNLLSKEKNSTSFDLLNFETGYTYLLKKKYEDALTYFGIVDTGFTNSTAAGQARFEMGYIYEKIYSNFDSASIFYLKAQSAPSTEEYAPLIKNKASVFSKYDRLNGEQAENIQKLKYVTDSTLFAKDSLEFVIADSLAKIALLEDQTQNVQQQNPQQGRTRNFGSTKNSESTSSDTKKSVQLKAPVRPNISGDSIKVLLVKTKFDLGNLFYTELDCPDSAFFYYNDLVEHYELQSQKPQVLYALANYYLARDTIKADSLLNYIYANYQHESIVNAAAEILKKPKIDLKYDLAKDLYREAEVLMQKDEIKSSLQKFLTIYEKYPVSEYAAKSLLASGYLLEEKLKLPDSAAVVYDSLVTKYPTTAFAQKVSPKLQTYKKEKERIRVALEDSLKKIAVEEIKKKTEDSLKVEMEKIKKKSEDSLKLELPKNPVNAADSLKTIETPKKETPAAPDSLRKEEGAIPPQANLLFQLKGNKEKFFLREDRRQFLFFRTSSTFSI